MSVSETVALKLRHRVGSQPTTARVLAPTSVQTQPARLVHYQPLVLVLAAMCAGIVADRLAWVMVPYSFALWWLLATVALGVLLVLWNNQHTTPAMTALLIAVLAAAGAWHHYRWNLFRDDELGRVAVETPQLACLEAIRHRR